MIREKYPTDLADYEWNLIESLFNVTYKEGGRPAKYRKREILNAILYILRTGCQWRYLPHDFPIWTTVYTYFRDWKKKGIFEKMNFDLIGYARIRCGRNKDPSAAIIDSQSSLSERLCKYDIRVSPSLVISTTKYGKLIQGN